MEWLAVEAARKLRAYLLTGIEGFKVQGLDRARELRLVDKPYADYGRADLERLIQQLDGHRQVA